MVCQLANNQTDFLAACLVVSFHAVLCHEYYVLSGVKTESQNTN
jgi:hypothetical protein